MAVEVGLGGLLPRPDLVERADHEAHQHGHRDVVPVFEQPRQQVREGDDARRGSDDEDHDDGNVQIAHGLHDILVFAQQQQDEGPGDAGQDHGADGDGARKHHEPPVVGGFCGRGDGDPPGRGGPCDEREEAPPVPASDLPGDEQRRGDDQPEEERPDGDGVVGQQIGHQASQRKDRNGDAQQHGQQETSVDMTPELAEAEFQQQLERRGVDAADRVEQFFVDTRNESDRTARDAGNYVGHTHGAPFERKYDVPGKIHGLFAYFGFKRKDTNKPDTKANLFAILFRRSIFGAAKDRG